MIFVLPVSPFLNVFLPRLLLQQQMPESTPMQAENQGVF